MILFVKGSNGDIADVIPNSYFLFVYPTPIKKLAYRWTVRIKKAYFYYLMMMRLISLPSGFCKARKYTPD